MLQYRKGNLFDYNLQNVTIAHACNALGVWGSGFALEFKNKFPKEFVLYKQYCMDNTESSGSCHLTEKAANLVTSTGYGRNVDPELVILQNTEKALDNLFGMKREGIIYSPKFNSGLFGISWGKTEQILKSKLNGTDIKWIVWEL